MVFMTGTIFIEKERKKTEEDCQSAPVPWCCCLGAGAAMDQSAKQRLIAAPVK